MTDLAFRWFWRGLRFVSDAIPAVFLLPGIAALFVMLLLIFCETPR